MSGRTRSTASHCRNGRCTQRHEDHHLGPRREYDVFASDDALIVTNEKRIVQQRKVDGLGKFLLSTRSAASHPRKTPDFAILGLWDADGFGYVLNLDDPELSEWGYGGVTRSDTNETERS